MSEDKTSWHPGDLVPASGIYECDCGEEHHWSTDVKGHRFRTVPPLPSDCAGEYWTLRTQAHPENSAG